MLKSRADQDDLTWSSAHDGRSGAVSALNGSATVGNIITGVRCQQDKVGLCQRILPDV